MDLWVVAAAAGAGYIAKNLQSLSLDKKESLCELSHKHSWSILSEPRNFRQQLRDRTCPLRRLARRRAQDSVFLEVENQSDASFPEIDRLRSGDLEAGAASTSGDVSEKFISDEDYEQVERDESRNLGKVYRGKIMRSRRCRLHSTRTLSSIGSRVDDQLFKELNSIEEDISCLYASMSTVRPVLVPDGGRVISKPSSNSSSARFEGCEEEARRSFEWLKGPDAMLLFITGMNIGIMSVNTAWQNEADKLKFKQAQSFVQDLHEELDVKEMLMVKELAGEGYPPRGENGAPRSIQEPISSPSDVNEKKSMNFDSLEASDEKAESPEQMSRIEAELQAELEMLEKNMEASAPEKISDFVQLESDFEPQGDLKLTKGSETYNDSSESENETYTATICTRPSNYSVCPWELSFRLHEFIESQLERRIKELETVLAESQNRVQFLGSQSMRFSYSRTESSSSTLQSPTCTCDEYEEPKGILPGDKDQDNGYGSISYKSAVVDENVSLELVQDLKQVPDQQMWINLVSGEDCSSKDEDTDESEMLLIKQILQRRKSDPNFTLNIQ